MKKAWLILAVLVAPFFAVYGQENTDDVYYSGDDFEQTEQSNEQQQAPTYQTFYDGLSPYGNWVNDPNYGYVWVPSNMDPDFEPYLSGGQWVYTTYGWTWVSDYAWGWAPFHYGRWFRDSFYGWIWIPGYDWAPAWVVWGDYGDYYCWAPVGPGGILGPDYRPEPHNWYFVPHGRITLDHIKNHVVSHDVAIHNDYTGINQHVKIVNHAGTYDQGVYFAGPKASEVQQYTGGKVERVNVTPVNKPGATKLSGNELNIYRPAISRKTEQHVAPAKVTRPERTQQPERNVNVPQQNYSEPQRQQPAQPSRQDWTPPRQSVPRENPPVQQQRNYTPPVQQQPQRPVDRGFVPSERPAPVPQQRQQPTYVPQQQPMQMPQRSAPVNVPRGPGKR